MNNLFTKFKLDNDSIIVCTKDIHQDIQEHYKNKLIPFRVMNYSTFINYMLGELSSNIKINLVKKGYNYELTKVLFNHFLPYYHLSINNEILNDVKEDILAGYSINKYIKNELSKKEIIFINPDLTNDLIKTTLNLYKNIYTYETSSLNKNNYNIYEFNNIDDEVDFVVKSISNDLLNTKDNIYVYYTNKDYLPILKSKLDLMNIKYTSDINVSFYETVYGRSLLSYIETHIDKRDSLIELFNEAISDIVSRYIISEENLEKIYKIFNEYTTFDINDYPYFKPFLMDSFKNEDVSLDKEIVNVNLISQLPTSFNNKNIYFLGCCQNSFPKLVKNSDYFNDSVREVNNLLTSKEINNFNTTNLVNQIYSLNKGILTYNTSFNQIISDVLIKLNKLTSIKNINNNVSKIYDEVEFAKALDNYYIYQEENDNLTSLYQSNVKDIYQSYSNKFNGTFKIDKNIKLSATSLETFYECKYRYYLEKVLHVPTYKDESSSKLGSYFHLMLKKLFNNEMNISDVDNETNIYMLDNNISDDEETKYYYNRYKEYVVKSYNIINDLYHKGTFTKIEFEKDIKHVLECKVNDSTYYDLVEGIIDKYFIYQVEELQKVLIVDYKTGDNKIDLNLLEYGLKIQVPYYFYLLSLGKENMALLGAFIQRVMPSKMYKHINKKTVDMQYQDELVYNGCFSSEDSDFLKNIIKNKDALSKEYIDSMIETINFLVNNSLMSIHEGDFTIDPKMIDKESTCKYCPYGTICYKTYQDFKYIEKPGGKK